MNIYELEKQATPGPYFYAKHLPGIQTTGVMEDTGLDDDSGNPIRAPLTVVNTTGACGGDNPCEDMRYMTHCRNHFMEALEALKELANRPDCEGPLCHYCDTGLPHPKIGGEETLKLIAELEEVK